MKKALLLGLAALVLPLRAEDVAVPEITRAATKFLSLLDDAKKAKAEMPFNSDEREHYRFTPHDDRLGLPLKEMDDAQKAAAMELLSATMSEKGKLKITQIMGLESLLAELEKDPVKRDPTKYFVSIFGTPGDAKGWGWRYEGHHLAVNLTLIGEKIVSVTPSFLGSNPGEVREGEKKGLRVLGAEEDLARALVTTLLSDGKSAVVFSEKSPTEILTAENRVATALDPEGIVASDMTDSQREALMTLITEYTGRYRDDVAKSDMEKIKAAGMDKIRFGWAGGTKPGEAYYYRVQGPSFLMEAVNSQNNANHIHAAWRDIANDFGRDVLHEHFSSEPH